MKTIVWDIDDVLNSLMKDWFEQKWLIENSGSLLIYNDIVQNPPHEVLKISFDDYKSSLDVFRTQYGKLLKPVPEIISWFKDYGSNYRHIALTAVPIPLSPTSAEWIFTHFGNWIRSFNIVPSRRETDPPFEYYSTKKEFLESFGKVDLLIDDNVFNIEGAKELGIKTILFPQPWNNRVFNTPQKSLQMLNEIM